MATPDMIPILTVFFYISFINCHLQVPDDEPSTLVLSVMHAGAPAHHVVTLDTTIRYRVDGTDYGQTDDLATMVHSLRRTRPAYVA
jgi:hypothetical protein